MTPEEKFDAAAESAVRDRRELIRFLEGISDEQAAWRHMGGEWSVAEDTEHILITDFQGEGVRIGEGRVFYCESIPFVRSYFWRI